MITEYELYSDEREVHYQNNRYLFIGGLVCTNNGRARIFERLREVRKKHDLTKEMKWQKVSRRYIDAYRDWVDVFFSDPYARYSILRINRSHPRWSRFRPRSDRKPTRDDRLASAFYQFLFFTFGPLRDTKRWWVHPDSGFFSNDNILNRVEFLLNFTYKQAFGQKSSRIIRFARSRNSKNENLVQLADVLLGTISWHILHAMPSGLTKAELVCHCQTKMLGVPKTRRNLPKLSIRDWVPPDAYEYAR
jgi:hypothetical protein